MLKFLDLENNKNKLVDKRVRQISGKSMFVAYSHE